VRAHRCRDVQPETLEAKLVAFSDSASHLVDSVYIDMIKKGNGEQVLSKLERDYRDLALIDGMQKEYQPLYEARKQLLTEMQKMYQ
jgi:predicted O-methyltransferase YrrM